MVVVISFAAADAGCVYDGDAAADDVDSVRVDSSGGGMLLWILLLLLLGQKY